MDIITVRLLACHPIVLRYLRDLLSSQCDFRLASDKEMPQVGVFDSALPSPHGALQMARIRFPLMRAVLLAASNSHGDAFRWMLQGAWGLVSYDRCPQELPAAVRIVASGLYYFPPPVVRRAMLLAGPWAGQAPPLQRSCLSPREAEVAALVSGRLSNKEIGSILQIRERTVKFHVGSIFRKLQVSSRQEVTVGGEVLAPLLRVPVAGMLLKSSA